MWVSSYGRIDLWLREDVKVFVIEAKPNPNISFGEDLPNPPAASASATSSRLRRSFPGPELSSKPNAMV